MKNNIIFKYQLKDAWGMERSMIEITEEKENNIAVKEYNKEDITYETIDSNIINESNRTLLKIPLSEKSIEISFNSSNQKVINKIITDGDIVFNKNYLILEIIFLVPSCVFLVMI